MPNSHTTALRRPIRRRLRLLTALLLTTLLVPAVVQAEGPLPTASVDIASKNMNPPRYPSDAFRAGIEGEVLVRVYVDAQGQWANATVASSSGSTQLDEVAVQATSKWKYNAAMDANGEPAEGYVQIPVVFALH